MPDRYTDYEQRPIRSGQGYTNTGRTAPSGAQRPSAERTGAGQNGAPRQVRPQQGTPGAARPAASGQVRQSAQGNYAQSGTPRQARPQQGTSGAARPAGAGQVRQSAQGNYAQSGIPRQARPQQGTSGAARPAASGQVRQSAQGGYAQRTVPSGAPRQARPQQGATRAGSAQRTPQKSAAHRPQQGNPPAMHPAMKIICGVLAVALLVTICLAITDKIQSGKDRPGISYNTQGTGGTETPETQAPTDAPAETEEPVPTDAPARSARIRVMGDVIIDDDMLENAHDESTDTYDFSPLFTHVKDVMADADWSIINIEASLREGRYGWSGFPTFTTPPSILDALKECGIDMLTMCNNHALDRYFDGLKLSLDLVDEAGLKHVGAYRTQAEFDTPEVYDICGIKVGMLNYTQYTNGMAAKSDAEATIYGMRLMSGADYAGDIADLRAAGAEYVIVIMHWGEEYMRYPESDIEQEARKIAGAGADLIIGGHPHTVQPAEYVLGTDENGQQQSVLTVYSIGNFVSNHRTELTDNGVIFEFTLQENDAGEIEMVSPAMIPVYVWAMDNGRGGSDYRVVTSGQYQSIADAPRSMSQSQFDRMAASYAEIEALIDPTAVSVIGY